MSGALKVVGYEVLLMLHCKECSKQFELGYIATKYPLSKGETIVNITQIILCLCLILTEIWKCGYLGCYAVWHRESVVSYG
jgi:hypothetical protein